MRSIASGTVFRSSRDLAIVGLMVLHGLRSCEVLALNREDVQLSELQIRVPGKGRKIRVLPLDRDSVKLLDHYLCLERPPQCGLPLFVSLKADRCAPPSHDSRRSAFVVSSSPAIHRREESEPAPLSTVSVRGTQVKLGRRPSGPGRVRGYLIACGGQRACSSTLGK